MRLDDLVPYEGNPRDNDKAVPEVAASIKAFGFKGAIVCDREHEGGTPEHPVIVNGHTRVKALKKLGYDEIPDEWVVYTDGLSEDEVKALRLADNRTAEAATWNRTLLRHEVKGIKSLDMSRFGFDFKSKILPYGAARLRGDRVWNLRLVDISDCAGRYEMPTLEPVDVRPSDMISFNFCKSTGRRDCGVHFCIDDYQFERVWNSPEQYLGLLGEFECVVCPDFSIYMDMPYPMKLWNLYRSRALGHWWQQQGLTVVPNVTWSGRDSFGYCFDGIPRGGTVFVSTVGVTRDREAAAIVRDGMAETLRVIRPSRVLMLGKPPDVDFGKCEVITFKPMGFRRENGKVES